MPELPDVTLYVEHLDRRIRGQVLERARVVSPNLLRTAEPPLDAVTGLRVTEVRRMGKRIVIAVEGGRFLVFHLMIAGRFRWREHGAKLPVRTTRSSGRSPIRASSPASATPTPTRSSIERSSRP